MLRRWILMLGLILMTAPPDLSAQSLITARQIGLAAYGAAVRDSRGFSVNPAGLVRIRDWDFAATTYASPSLGQDGFVFHGLTFGKRFLENEAAAFQYSPGTTMKFVVPPTINIDPPNNPTSNDREIQYSEPFSIGAAHRFVKEFSVGLGARFRRETLTQTTYEIIVGDTATFPSVSVTETRATSWNVDASVLWSPSDVFSLGLIGRNLLTLGDVDAPGDLSAYRLSSSAIGEISLATWATRSLLLAASAATDQTGALGGEWTPGHGIAVRAGLYFSADESPAAYATGLGLGWSYEFLELGVAYLHFFDQTNRQGSSPAGEFDPSVIRNIDLNPYTSDRVSLTVKAIFGNIRERLALIESVEMFGSVYPSSHEVFAYNPIGTTRVKNISSKPIHAKAAFFVDNYMDEPTESRPVTIQPGESVDIPLTAVFNERIGKVSTLTIKEGNVTINASPAEQEDDRYQTPVLIHGRNAWDGDALTLRYFVTPDDPDVIRYSRDVLLDHRDSLVQVDRSLESFRKARILFDDLAGKLMYVNDPKQSSDYVQYPAETLRLRGGDCDDLSVCFVSLLSSIGISTAFVDVIPPGRPEESHIYLLFDTGVDPKFGSHVSPNPKRYVVRKDKRGIETVWIPMETTAVARGFDEAWTRGAQEYFDDVEVGLGTIKGWVRIVDIN
jgi:hypothetical protein